MSRIAYAESAVRQRLLGNEVSIIRVSGWDQEVLMATKARVVTHPLTQMVLTFIG